MLVGVANGLDERTLIRLPWSDDRTIIAAFLNAVTSVEQQPAF